MVGLNWRNDRLYVWTQGLNINNGMSVEHNFDNMEEIGNHLSCTLKG
jgi:hypothetical protein